MHWMKLRCLLCYTSECHTAASTLHSECHDGDIQLVGGNSPLEGRLEVCINSAWGTVCNNLFSDHDAAIACDQLGFERTGQYA